jgi:hypothetical protein
MLAGCSGADAVRGPLPPEPPLAEFCREAQHVVGHTNKIGELVLHADEQAFVKSKTSIDPLTIHQFIWYADPAKTKPLMVSCKLKSADHLNSAFGAGTAGPEGDCQEMNRLTVARLEQSLPRVKHARIELDPRENVFDDANPGAAGPNWLKPAVLVDRRTDGTLVIHAKGFRVDWNDPRFATLDAKFRGVHYCHLIAPSYLRELLGGEAAPGISVGRDVAATPPPGMPSAK